MGDYNKKRSPAKAPHTQDVSRTITLGGQTIEPITYDSAGDLLYGTCTTVPADAQTGFAKGCVLIDTNVGTGTSGTFVNVGTNTSCVFDLVEGVGNQALASADIFVGNGSGIATAVTASGDVTNDNLGAFTIANDAVTEAKVVDSAGVGVLGVMKFAICKYDFAVDGGTEGTITLASTATIPDNAICWLDSYEVITTFTSSGDAATVSIDLPTDGALTTAIAINDADNALDAGQFSVASRLGIFVDSGLTKKTTGARALQLLTAGGQDLTAGKAIFRIAYWVSE